MIEVDAKIKMDDEIHKKYKNGEVDLRGAAFGNKHFEPFQEIEILDNDNSENSAPDPLPVSDSHKNENTDNSNATLAVAAAFVLGVGAKVLYDKAKPKIAHIIEERQKPSENAIEIQQNFNTALKFYASEPNNPQAISELQYLITKLKSDNKKDAKFLKKNLTEKINTLLLFFEEIDNKSMKKLHFEDKLDKLDYHFKQLQKKNELIKT